MLLGRGRATGDGNPTRGPTRQPQHRPTPTASRHRPTWGQCHLSDYPTPATSNGEWNPRPPRIRERSCPRVSRPGRPQRAINVAAPSTSPPSTSWPSTSWPSLLGRRLLGRRLLGRRLLGRRLLGRRLLGGRFLAVDFLAVVGFGARPPARAARTFNASPASSALSTTTSSSPSTRTSTTSWAVSVAITFFPIRLPALATSFVFCIARSDHRSWLCLAAQRFDLLGLLPRG